MPNTAVITGASSGIGLELARVFAREGYNLLITARRRDRLSELKQELENRHNITVHIIDVDLSEPDAPGKLFKFAVENKLPVSVLVNNAGIGDYGFFKDADWNRLSAIIDLNIKSLTHLTHLFIPELLKHEEAYIMNVASTAAFQPGPLMSIYYASKHYVLAFSEAIANELSDSGIKVSALCPGPTESEFQDVANMKKSKLFDRFPVATSQEVAEYGYKSLIKGKRVAIYGLTNKIAPKFISLVPRCWVTAAVRKIQERK
ncbi:MAG: SDR family oxidoreductase [Balneolaceae bacterium]|nr:SDR family oxidoreductase [Balneolaceae bacterium]